MKKLKSLIILFSMILTIFLVASCGNKTIESPHKHSYTITNHNDTVHWKECSCGEKSEEETHSFGEWIINDTMHWKECSCGAKSEEIKHSFGDWEVTKEATTSNTGIKERKCKICLYKENEATPMKTVTEGLSYSLNEDKKSYSVTGIGTATDTVIIIPSTYMELPVTNIKDSAFLGCINITCIEVPMSVISIGKGAFKGCSNLTKITIPFVGDRSTRPFNSSFSYIFDVVHPSLTDVIITGGTIIEDGFRGCENIKNITLPSSIKAIGPSAFEMCTGLENVYYEGTLEDWCNINFYYSSPSFIQGNPMYWGNHFFLRNSSNEWEELTNLKIPNTITKIGSFQFCGFEFTSIVIPDHINSIGSYAFHNCRNLTSIVLPATLEIYNDAFETSGLTEIFFKGSYEDWLAVYISSYHNDNFLHTTRYYYSETPPSETGNYWHYVDGVVTKWN